MAHTWEKLGYWVWLLTQSRDVTPWIAAILHEKEQEEDRRGKFSITELVSGDDPKHHLLVLQALVELQEADEQSVTIPRQALLDLIAEAKTQAAAGLRTSAVRMENVPTRIRRFTRWYDKFPKQSINPAPRKQVRLLNQPYSAYVPK